MSVGMLLEYFELREEPFGESPDPAFLFKRHRNWRAFEAMLQSIEDQRIQMLIAPPGCGKTTLLYLLQETLGDRARSIFYFYTLATREEFLEFLVSELGGETRGVEIGALRAALQSELRRESRKVVVLIDEAQHLQPAVLDEIDELLSSSPKNLRIVIAGQSQLWEQVREVRYRSVSRAELHTLYPLDSLETEEYIRHRLTIAGYSGPGLFTPEAITTIFERSQGIPRQINSLCFLSMVRATVSGNVEIDRKTVEKAMVDPGFAYLAGEESSVPLEPVVPQNSVSGDDDMADAILLWLGQHSKFWVGTGSELLGELKSSSNEMYEVPASWTASYLSERIESSLDKLRSRGIEAEVRDRPGSPRLISLRLSPGKDDSIRAAS